ncbi:MAG: AtpZ/AtpI family protein [Saprospiraceae bacterium]|nr:AtpZ/AtpI family protein [Saprospiraceae bacterium]MBK8450586.1 AtpZ/AtpI family protein [Saprospiraceae bacterium]MBK8485335.1 AtpZ/AtpI family protein [Saprospiraceae bacterium]MBK9222554.1 AtpZ/AtpI family protein [Saprospiraceae bacterium]MBK9720413.1 AtpZ/AtpI family protein [Saprospiraceae bacterium]
MAKFDLKSNKILKYSGLATQIFVSLGLAAFFGRWLDQKFELTKPLLTAILPILMLVLLMFWLNYDLKKLEK